MKKRLTAIIYARVSTVKQADEGLPIASQVEQGAAKAAALGAMVLRTFLDEGISGRSDRRPAFQDAIAYCSSARVDYFVVWNTSRFARNKIDAASYKALLRQGGTKVVYAAGDIDSDSDEGWFSESIFEIVDEHYSRVIARDTRRSMMKNARDGFFNGGRVPFGYTPVPDGRRRRLQVVETEAQTVRDIFARCLQGSGSLEIARWLNESGRSKRGERWNKVSVGLILKNPVYTGHIVFGRTDHRTRSDRPESEWILTPSHTPIIDQETFMRAKSAMGDRAPRENSGSPHSRFVFTGLLRCGACGESMQTESATGRAKIYHYYNCRGAQKGKGCPHRRIPAAEFDDWLIDGILDRVLTEERIAEMVREVYEMRGEWCIERRRQREALVAELRSVEKKRDALFEVLELHGKEAPNLGDLTTRLRAHKKRIDELESSLARMEDAGDQIDLPINAEQVVEATRFFREIIATTDDPVKLRTFFSSFVERVVLDGDSVRVEYAREKIVMNQGSAVHSEVRWLPDHSTLRTTAVIIELPRRWRRAA